MILTTRTLVAGTLVTAVALTPAALVAQQSRPAGVRTSGPAALGIHGFSVVLVVGSLSAAGATSATDGVPEAAKKALADMKDFLPYKRYQLLDAAWMLCCASPRTAVAGVVRGPEERDYRYEVDPIGVSDTKLDVRFTIRENRGTPSSTSGRTAMHPAEMEYSRLMADAMRERQEANRELTRAEELRRKGLITASDFEARSARRRLAEQRVNELRASRQTQTAQTASGRDLIDSTFSISLGETVVVGTSRLHGDRALIAILTAAAKPAATR